METGWGTAIQAVIIALATWYMRAGANRDKDKVISSTAAQTTSNEILQRVKTLEEELRVVKTRIIKDTGGLDHRGPTKGN